LTRRGFGHTFRRAVGTESTVSSTRAGSGFSRVHQLFLVLVGLAGWAVLACAAPPLGAWPSFGAAALFLIVAGGARALAFPLAGLDGETEVSLDSAIFIAATACLGARVTAVGVGFILAADSIARALRQPERSPCERSDSLCIAAHAIYAGGLAGGLLAVVSRAFGVGHLPGGDAGVVRVAALGFVFLLSHYLVQTVQLTLAGHGLRAAIRRNTFGVLAEATLLPLAAAIVLIWAPTRAVPFALLGGTYLLVNWGFNRVANLAAGTRRRVLELEILNRTAHALGATLEVPEVMAALLRETARALPAATRLEAIVNRGVGQAQKYALGPDGRIQVRPAEEDTRRWLKLKEPLVDEDTLRAIRSRVVVPLTMYGETIGALVAEAPIADAFGPNQRRLLDAIGSQAAAAVENARLYALANIDGLTGLYCRRYLDVRIADEIERAHRFGTSFALILMDLDDFKQLNDTLGHQAGDRALREVAAIAASQLRGVDLAARYGGEELAFLLPRTSLADAQAVAERIREAVAMHSLVENGRRMRITASLGVAGWAESGVDDLHSLVARADAALYRAKAAGKNRVAIDLVSFEIGPSLAPVRRRRA
jgi:diguanylate cyclase (GGDEF)-like protein